MRTALSLAGLVAVLAGCDVAEPSTDVNQDRIHTRYELIYDGTADVTEPRASFRFGNAAGTQLRLEGRAGVAFDGDALALQTPLNITFYNDRIAGLTSSGTFVYTDGDGETFENTASLRSIGTPASIGPIDNDQATTLTWQGAPVGEDETVRVVLYRVSADTRLAVFTQDDEGATSVVLDRGQLGPVQPGEITLVVSRLSERPADEAPGAGGVVVTDYSAPAVQVQIVD